MGKFCNTRDRPKAKLHLRDAEGSRGDYRAKSIRISFLTESLEFLTQIYPFITIKSQRNQYVKELSFCHKFKFSNPYILVI